MNHGIAIVDDHHGAREGLAALVRMSPGLHLVAVCKNGHGALQELPLALPAVVLVDTDLRDLPGAECIRRLRSLVPQVEIIVLTSRIDVPRICEAIAAGANGYLLKDVAPARILEAITEVLTGGSPMAPGVARRLVERVRDEPAKPAEPAGLSRREEQVLREHALGFRAKEVATNLSISTFTVQTHVRKIYFKLGVNSIAQAVVRYYGVDLRPVTISHQPAPAAVSGAR